MRHISAVLALFLHVLLTKLLSFFLISEKVSAADLAVLMQFNQIARSDRMLAVYQAVERIDLDLISLDIWF